MRPPKTVGTRAQSPRLRDCSMGNNRKLGDSEILRLTIQFLRLEGVRFGHRRIFKRLDGTPGCRPYGVLEPLGLTVAKLHGPHYRVGSPKRCEACAEGDHVAVSAHIDG